MKKNDYINEVDALHVPQALRERIRSMPETKTEPIKSVNIKKYISLAAVLCVILVASLIAIPAFSTMGAMKESAVSDGDYKADNYGDGYAFSDQDNPSESVSSTAYSPVVPSTRKLIRNANIRVDTKNFTSFCDSVEKKAGELGGYVECSDSSEGYGGNRNATIVLRIPADNLDALLSHVSDNATVRFRSTEVQDVTENYIDIESRLNALRTEQTALLALLEKADSLSEILEIQGRLSEVRGSLESLEGQLKSLDSQIAYSKVTLDVSEVEHVSDTGDSSFFSLVRAGLSENLYSIGRSMRSGAIAVLAGLPYILIWGVIIAVVVLIIRHIVRKRRMR